MLMKRQLIPEIVMKTRQVRFQNEASMQHATEKAPPPDGFDDWVNVRDQRLWGRQPLPFGVYFGYPPPLYGPPGF
jgi:hypothetical protein